MPPPAGSTCPLPAVVQEFDSSVCPDPTSQIIRKLWNDDADVTEEIQKRVGTRDKILGIKYSRVKTAGDKIVRGIFTYKANTEILLMSNCILLKLLGYTSH